MNATTSKDEIAERFEVRLINYLIQEYFDGDAPSFCKRVLCTGQQLKSWRSGSQKPQKSTLKYMLSATIAPEFKIASEFARVDFPNQKSVLKVLSAALNGHDHASGVYSFYDSLCNVVYVGKASVDFRKEMYQQLVNPLGIDFPKTVKTAPKSRWEVVKYVSAYEIPSVEHLDYPKHVEAIVLRLSKPVGNKNLGNLEMAVPPKIR